jgi:choline-sulfatase
VRQRPDIILILTDQLSAGASSAWGWPGIRTPHLDHLIAEGVSCTRAYCTNPVCVPSRFSLMTGLMPSVGSTRSNRPGIERQPPEIMRAGLGHHLRAAGYQALYAGKQHLPAMDATDCGFEVLTTDERDGCAATAARCLGAAHDAPLFLVASFIGPHDVCYVPSLRIEPEGMTGTAARLGRETIERVSAPWIGLDAVGLRAFVEEHAPPMPANHARNGSEPPLLERIDGRHPLLGIPHRQWDATAWRLSRWIYDRLIEDVDRQIGVVLDAIALHRPEALVLFTSDHGEMNGSHQLTQKNVCYEEAIKVPLVARWPGRIAPGSRCEQLISNGLDIHPTILGAAGRAPQQGQTGRDLLPLWRGEQPPAWRDRLQIELDGGDCVHDGRRKCERYDDGTVIVRDLVADPLELERADPGVAAAIMG